MASFSYLINPCVPLFNYAHYILQDKFIIFHFPVIWAVNWAKHIYRLGPAQQEG